MEVGGVFKVRTLDNCIHRARLLAKATEDALGHVDVVFGGAARTVRAGLRLNHDSEGGAGGLAEFAGNAALLTSGVSAEGMFSSEVDTEGSLLPGVVDNMLATLEVGALTSGSKAAQVTWNHVGQSISVINMAAWVPSKMSPEVMLSGSSSLCERRMSF